MKNIIFCKIITNIVSAGIIALSFVVILHVGLWADWNKMQIVSGGYPYSVGAAALAKDKDGGRHIVYARFYDSQNIYEKEASIWYNGTKLNWASLYGIKDVDIAVGPNKDPRIVFYQNVAGVAEYFSYFYKKGGEFVYKKISMPINAVYGCAIDVASDGASHIALLIYDTKVNKTSVIFYRISPDGEQVGWSRIDTDIETYPQGLVAISVDKDDDPHILYTKKVGSEPRVLHAYPKRNKIYIDWEIENIFSVAGTKQFQDLDIKTSATSNRIYASIVRQYSSKDYVITEYFNGSSWEGIDHWHSETSQFPYLRASLSLDTDDKACVVFTKNHGRTLGIRNGKYGDWDHENDIALDDYWDEIDCDIDYEQNPHVPVFLIHNNGRDVYYFYPTPPTGGRLAINNDSPYTNNNKVTLTYTSSPDAYKIQVSNDKDGPWTAPLDFTGTYNNWNLTAGYGGVNQDGSKEVSIFFKGAGGLWTEYRNYDRIILDREAPQMVFTSVPPKKSNSRTANFEWKATNEPYGCEFSYQLDGGNWSGYGNYTAKTYEGTIADGQHRFMVAAKDPANNYSVSPHLVYYWEVDATPPDTFIDTMPAKINNIRDCYFEYHSNEPFLQYNIRLNENGHQHAWEYTTREWAKYWNMDEGTMIFEVKAYDLFSNSDPTPAKYQWVNDFTKPTGDISINNGQSITQEPIVTLNLSAQDNLTGVSKMVFTNKLDGANTPWSPQYSYNTTYEDWDVTDPQYGGNSEPGEKTVYVQFGDEADNWSDVYEDSINYNPHMTYMIAGDIKDSGENPIEGVEVQLTGDESRSVSTNVQGYYEFTDLETGNYTVTPTKQGWSFDPVKREYTPLSQNMANQNFTGTLIPDPKPAITVSHTSLEFTVVEGNNPQDKSFTITNSGDQNSTLNWTLSDDADWLEVGPPASGQLGHNQTSDDIPVTITSVSLPPDTYNAIITVSDPNATNNPQTIAVQLIVDPKPTYSISGIIKNSNNNPMQDVEVDLSGNASESISTNAQGYYEFTDLIKGIYTITPNKQGWTFEPLEINYNPLSQNMTNQNFMGSENQQPVAAITLSTTAMEFRAVQGGSNPQDQSFTVTNTGDPNSVLHWSATENAPWLNLGTPVSGALNQGETSQPPTPVAIDISGLEAKTYYANIVVSDPDPNVASKQIVVTLIIDPEPTYSISGTIKDSNNNPMQDVEVDLSGNASESISTNAQGYYEFTDLVKGIYTITPNKQGWTFDPLERNFTPLSQNMSDQNFTGTENQTPVAIISVNPTVLNFTVIEGNNPSDKSFTVTNTGSQNSTLNWSATESASWLSIGPPTSGQLAQGQSSGAIPVTVTSASLDPDTYQTMITVSDPDPNVASKQITVNLTVQSKDTVTVTYPNGGEQIAGECEITWSWTGTWNAAIISYLDGQEEHMITVAGNDGSYEWDTAGLEIASCKILIKNAFNPQVMDDSDNPFMVDHKAPDKPVLNTPANHAVISNNKPQFDWSDVSDLNGVFYDLEVCLNGNVLFTIDDRETSEYTHSSALPNGVYTWKIRSNDGLNHTLGWTDFFDFTIQNGSFVPPTISVSPESYEISLTVGDADPDDFTITVRNIGEQTSVLNWHAVSSTEWLSLSPQSGQLNQGEG
ncbi:MAG: hypothetical protein GF384_04140, partial [Elusimicrobia bacterium]|nr:hypothetical protein [Elusimicrobiota bacterium]